MIDLHLKGGMVVDGTGADPIRADVVVAEGSIVDVGLFGDVEAETVVDCVDRMIMPGFIDTHSHADAAVFSVDVQLALLRQGITTVLAGQDGVSFAPGSSEYAATYFGALNGTHPHFQGGSVADLLATYDGGTSPINVGYLVPQGTVRATVMGYTTGMPSRAELDEMTRLVVQGLDDGALGLSSGMDYFPGAEAGPLELAELCRPLAEIGAVYVSHIRGGYEDRSPIGVAEVEEVMDLCGVRGHISHYHGPSDLLLGIVNGAADRGQDLTFDSYPYRHGFTLLSTILLPHEVQRHGPHHALQSLADRVDRKRLADESLPLVTERFGAEWAEGITMSHLPAGKYEWAAGCTLAEASAQEGREALEFAFTLMAESQLSASAIFAFPAVSGDDDVVALSQHHAHMTGSDGIYIGANPHPRGWGTFARLLGHHTRDRGDWNWGTAALHLAGRPARRFLLGNRGIVRKGAIADLAVIHPEEVKDLATYAQPRRLAEGIDDVIVNGQQVLADGKLTGAMPGAGLRRA